MDRGWEGWMASPTQWTRVWASSGSWWWTGRPGVLQSMGSQRVGHDWATQLNWWTVKEHQWNLGLPGARLLVVLDSSQAPGHLSLQPTLPSAGSVDSTLPREPAGDEQVGKRPCLSPSGRTVPRRPQGNRALSGQLDHPFPSSLQACVTPTPGVVFSDKPWVGQALLSGVT